MSSLQDLDNKIAATRIQLKLSRGTVTEKVFADVLNKLLESRKKLETGETVVRTPDNYYYCVAWIKGKVIIRKTKNTRQYFVKYQNKLYPAQLLTKNSGGFVSRKEVFDKYCVGRDLILGIYPRWIHFPDKKPPVLKFSVFSWYENEEDFSKLGEKLDTFKVSGIYQKIPASKAPVLSVYRNSIRHKSDNLKTNHVPTNSLISKVPLFSGKKSPQNKPKLVKCEGYLDIETDRLVVTIYNSSNYIPKYIKPLKKVRKSLNQRNKDQKAKFTRQTRTNKQI